MGAAAPHARVAPIAWRRRAHPNTPDGRSGATAEIRRPPRHACGQLLREGTGLRQHRASETPQAFAAPARRPPILDPRSPASRRLCETIARPRSRHPFSRSATAGRGHRPARPEPRPAGREQRSDATSATRRPRCSTVFRCRGDSSSTGASTSPSPGERARRNAPASSGIPQRPAPGARLGSTPGGFASPALHASGSISRASSISSNS